MGTMGARGDTSLRESNTHKHVGVCACAAGAWILAEVGRRDRMVHTAHALGIPVG
jgi:hypothetical protein